MFGGWGIVSANPTDRTSVRNSVKRHRGPLPFPPLYTPSPSTSPSNEENPFSNGVPADQSFYRFFQQVRRITDITPAHFTALNISIAQNVPLEEIVDPRFIPADDPELLAALTAAADSNDRTVRSGDAAGAEESKEEKDKKEWIERCRECLLDNETAFQAVARIRRDVKLGFLYRFYQALELVDPYYDLTPLDEEEEKKKKKEEEEEEAAKNGNGKRPASPEGMEIDGKKKKEGVEEDDGDDDDDVEMADAAGEEGKEGAGKKRDRNKEKWNMPERFREDLVKAFIEPLCWNHAVRVYPPRAPPKLAIQSSLFSIHLTDYVHRPATTPQEARKGFVSGPVLGTQIRHEHLFRALSDPTALLIKRRKKMLASAKPSAPKKPRSSRSKSKEPEPEKSAAAKEIADDSTDDLAFDEGLLTLDGNDMVGAAREVGALLHLAQLRNKIQGEEDKDKKLRLCAYGRQPGSSKDDVYLITSIHHHIAISHAKVSDRYLRFLKTGKTRKSRREAAQTGDATAEDEKDWEKLEIKKSRYYDIMVPQERVEAARAVVAVLRALSYIEEEKEKKLAEEKAKAEEEAKTEEKEKAPVDENKEQQQPEARQVELRA